MLVTRLRHPEVKPKDPVNLGLRITGFYWIHPPYTRLDDETTLSSLG